MLPVATSASPTSTYLPTHPPPPTKASPNFQLPRNGLRNLACTHSALNKRNRFVNEAGQRVKSSTKHLATSFQQSSSQASLFLSDYFGGKYPAYTRPTVSTIMVTPFGFFRGNTSTPAPATVSTDVTAQANNTQGSAASPVIQSLQDAASGRMSHPISRRQSPTIATTTSNAMASPRPTLPPNALEIANSQAADLLRAMAQR